MATIITVGLVPRYVKNRKGFLNSSKKMCTSEQKQSRRQYDENNDEQPSRMDVFGTEFHHGDAIEKIGLIL